MTVNNDDLMRHLCGQAAMLMGGAASFIRSPPDEMDDLIGVLEGLARRSEIATKLIAAALALAE